MLSIDALKLPPTLPHPKAISSWKQTKAEYEPDCWEFQYDLYRYLELLSDDALVQRYSEIVRNMHAIVSAERDVIPINSFLSSWYWFRKEHQTRYEFALRNLPFHTPLPVIAPRGLTAAPARPRSPNAGDVLFRYGEHKWLQGLIDFGRLRMRSAGDYALMEKDPARQDDEQTKHSYSPGRHVTITFPDGKKLHPIGDVKQSVSGTDYFLYCVSMDWDTMLFEQFSDSDCCVIIKRPEEFARRLERAAASKLPGWYFYNGPIEYFDPYEQVTRQRIDNAMSKDFRFAYQREHRFLLAGLGKAATGYIDLEIGPLHDIAELHMRPAA
ncbi:MAG: hypothetical protein AB7F74_08265 [Parvibaculaceae bacterium]